MIRLILTISIFSSYPNIFAVSGTPEMVKRIVRVENNSGNPWFDWVEAAQRSYFWCDSKRNLNKALSSKYDRKYGDYWFFKPGHKGSYVKAKCRGKSNSFPNYKKSACKYREKMKTLPYRGAYQCYNRGKDDYFDKLVVQTEAAKRQIYNDLLVRGEASRDPETAAKLAIFSERRMLLAKLEQDAKRLLEGITRISNQTEKLTPIIESRVVESIELRNHLNALLTEKNDNVRDATLVFERYHKALLADDLTLERANEIKSSVDSILETRNETLCTDQAKKLRKVRSHQALSHYLVDELISDLENLVNSVNDSFQNIEPTKVIRNKIQQLSDWVSVRDDIFSDELSKAFGRTVVCDRLESLSKLADVTIDEIRVEGTISDLEEIRSNFLTEYRRIQKWSEEYSLSTKILKLTNRRIVCAISLRVGEAIKAEECFADLADDLSKYSEPFPKFESLKESRRKHVKTQVGKARNDIATFKSTFTLDDYASGLRIRVMNLKIALSELPENLQPEARIIRDKCQELIESIDWENSLASMNTARQLDSKLTEVEQALELSTNRSSAND